MLAAFGEEEARRTRRKGGEGERIERGGAGTRREVERGSRD
jgi:hypothetical protein